MLRLITSFRRVRDCPYSFYLSSTPQQSSRTCAHVVTLLARLRDVFVLIRSNPICSVIRSVTHYEYLL